MWLVEVTVVLPAKAAQNSEPGYVAFGAKLTLRDIVLAEVAAIMLVTMEALLYRVGADVLTALTRLKEFKSMRERIITKQ